MPIIFALFAALLIKHYVADFVLQPSWMLKGKGSLTAPGGYAHAAFHALGSGALFALAGVSAIVIVWTVLAEFVIHFAIDYAKDRLSARPDVERHPHLYWQLHGLDQLLHQLTYVGITWFAAASLVQA